MGSLNAIGMADAARAGHVGLRQAIAWHLDSNHFPPIPATTGVINACIEAIEAANEGDWDREITLPLQMTYRGHGDAPAWAIIEQHHLDAFVEGDEW